MTLRRSVHQVGDATVLWAAGRIDTEDFEHWISTLQLVSIVGSGPILMDLTAVERWTVGAQVAVLHTAQRAAAADRVLALCRPNPQLRAGTQLPVFERLTTYEESADIVIAGLRLPRQRMPGGPPAGEGAEP